MTPQILHLAIGSLILPLVYICLLPDRLGASVWRRGIGYKFKVAGVVLILVMPMMSVIHPIVQSGVMTRRAESAIIRMRVSV